MLWLYSQTKIKIGKDTITLGKFKSLAAIELNGKNQWQGPRKKLYKKVKEIIDTLKYRI